MLSIEETRFPEQEGETAGDIQPCFLPLVQVSVAINSGTNSMTQGPLLPPCYPPGWWGMRGLSDWG